MNRSRNDVALLPIPFADLTNRKVRPAVMIGRSGPDLVLVPISAELSNTGIPIKEGQAAGLNVPCGVKAQIATAEERSVVKLAMVDGQTIGTRLRTWLPL